MLSKSADETAIGELVLSDYVARAMREPIFARGGLIRLAYAAVMLLLSIAFINAVYPVAWWIVTGGHPGP